MDTTKRTYSIARETVEEFEASVPPGKRSSMVDQAMRDWIDGRKRAALRSEVIVGCQDMAEVYGQIEREYHALEEELQHAIDAQQPSPRSGRAGSPRPRRGL